MASRSVAPPTGGESGASRSEGGGPDPAPTPPALELRVYRDKLPELLASEGKFVLIQGEVIHGILATRDEALEAGYLKHGDKPFLVKRILDAEPVRFFTRELG
ncbi:hypothetical protein [Paludisphaera sp.]|uniref:hypothetical protein n=1 Tax=Paludisphaera sp. TaxID=2017432 RepID=UPI00301CFD9B